MLTAIRSKRILSGIGLLHLFVVQPSCYSPQLLTDRTQYSVVQTLHVDIIGPSLAHAVRIL